MCRKMKSDELHTYCINEAALNCTYWRQRFASFNTYDQFRAMILVQSMGAGFLTIYRSNIFVASYFFFQSFFYNVCNYLQMVNVIHFKLTTKRLPIKTFSYHFIELVSYTLCIISLQTNRNNQSSKDRCLFEI